MPKPTSGLLLSAVLLLSLLLASPQAAAQDIPSSRISDPNFNAWLMFFSDAQLTNRWGLHTEAQLRRADGLKSPLQEFARLGLNFNLSDQVMLTGGYAYALTHPYGDFPVAEKFPEHRLYQQLLLKSTYGPFQVAHRFRLEQRWLRRPLETDYTYLNRTRYQVRAAMALVRPSEGIQPRTPYLAVSNEVFINYGKNVTRNIFDQNRAYGAFGYQFTKALAIEAGYLHQLLAQGNGTVFEYNHTLQLGIYYNPDFRRSSTNEPN
ncbi:DUF2490 domain-containing protein [Hymenobacter arizonensis]|uniref:DUF2490 domain-containing protein n=1 Tax=Hymenobacter arizonensis TaxID=1227077 RepID=A0A1I5UUX9_HYMAR|nr:DUF2490 domain-containing protein [Hymenobacter arizonensis]SFP99010.1 Protein of unknown function [Hymenobacter arizonensis]